MTDGLVTPTTDYGAKEAYNLAYIAFANAPLQVCAILQLWNILVAFWVRTQDSEHEHRFLVADPPSAIIAWRKKHINEKKKLHLKQQRYSVLVSEQKAASTPSVNS